MSNREINAQLLAALKDLFADYKELADSGDAGFWSLEDLPVGKQAMEAIAAAEAEQPKSTLEKYNEMMSDCTENDPLERLRFFCSLAMNSQDWLDVERFFIDMQQQPASEPVAWKCPCNVCVSPSACEEYCCAIEYGEQPAVPDGMANRIYDILNEMRLAPSPDLEDAASRIVSMLAAAKGI